MSLLPARLYNRRHRRTRASYVPGRVYSFPKAFLWGAATASHQVEGMDSGSDWWQFERIEGKVRNFANYSRHAQDYKSDHWRLFEDDLRRMKRDMGLNAYRFSVDWSRIEPEEGRFDERVLERYGDMCSLMRSLDIRPCVTLFHWSSPQWIWDKGSEGGWRLPNIVDRFRAFCRAVVPVLSPYVDMFCTLNEPNMFLYGGFSEGLLAPGQRLADFELIPVLRHLLRCHVEAYRVIKEHHPRAEVGIAQNFYLFEPESPMSPLEGVAAAQAEQAFSWLAVDAIATGRFVFTTRNLTRHSETIEGLLGTADFVGVNYYERVFVRVPHGIKIWDLRVLHEQDDDKEIWPKESYSRGLASVLEKAYQRYRLPIYVTENGRAHPDDRQRTSFLRDHLATIGHVIASSKVDVRGYFYWSLLDNQEWHSGFLPRLGLYEVDYDSGERRLRDTGRFYGQCVERNSVEAPMLDQEEPR